MFGKEISRLRKFGWGPSQLRSLVPENRKAASSALANQYSTLINPGKNALNTVIPGSPGWKRFNSSSISALSSVNGAYDFDNSNVIGDLRTDKGRVTPEVFGKVVNR